MLRAKKKAKAGVSALAVIFLILVAAIAIVGLYALIYNSAVVNPVLVRTQTGLVVSDFLTSGNTNIWRFGGDAVAENATYNGVENSSGLYLGVQPIDNGQWAGYYATLSAGTAQIFTAKLTLPYTTISNGSFNTGLYVQTAQLPVNYVACGAGVTPQGSYWQVVIGQGNITLASNFNVLFFQPGVNESITRTCTIITNGNNLLTAYIDGVQVYSSSNLNLDMPQPFNSYLLVDAKSTDQVLYGSYTNYTATLGDALKVTNAPAGGVVKILANSSNVLASAPIGSDGSATLLLPVNGTVITGSINVYNSNGKLVTSTSQPVEIWGGDVYSLKGSL